MVVWAAILFAVIYLTRALGMSTGLLVVTISEPGVGVNEVQFGGSASRGIVSGWERGIAWGIQENFAPGRLYDYTFTPAIVKNPVINTLLHNGWDVRFAIF
jgi:hypothetical protein